MATARHTLVVALSVIITILLLIFAGGCQSQQAFVQNRPAPSFNGPVVVPSNQPPPVAMKPTAPTKQQPKSDAKVPKDWIPYAQARAWKWIVIHHSATPTGSAAVFDKMHREKGWDELGYDFVIGNGTDSGNGQIEVGPRWAKQKWGAHAKTPDNQYNERGIGICLVGNFDESRPTDAQMKSLARLTSYLMKTYKIKSQDVIGHGDTKATDCPGRYMNVAALRRQVQALADASITDMNPGDLDPNATAITEPQPAAASDPSARTDSE